MADEKLTEVVVTGGLFRHGRPGTARRTARPGDIIHVGPHDLERGLKRGRLRLPDESDQAVETDTIGPEGVPVEQHGPNPPATADVEAYSTGGGWYEIGDRKVRGEDAARQALADLEE